MATEYRLSYTASEIDSKLGKIDSLANKTDVPTKTSDLTNDSGFATQTYVQNFAQPKGDYALRSELPEVPDAPVSSVNGQTGEVQLTAHDVGALPNTVEIPVNLSDLADDSTHRLVTDDEKTSWSAKAEVSAIPKNLGELVNDVGYLTAHQDLSDYAKTSDVTTIIAAHNTNGSSHNDLRILIENVKTDLKAIADSDDETLDQMSEVVAYIKSNKELIDAITTSKVSVADIVDDLVTNVSTKPLSAAQGVALKTMIEAIVVPTKVSDLANDVGFITEIPTEYITEAELSERGYLTEHQSLDGYAKTSELGTLAAKDVVAKSDLTEEVQASLDKADTALQSYTETDPTVPAWAKAVNPPTYTAADVGALPNTTVIPDALADLTEDTEHRLVSDAEKAVWNAKLEQSDIPTNVSAFTNDSGYLTSSAIEGLATESYVGSMLEAIDYPVDSVNGKTGAVVLSASDVGADPVGVAEEAISAHDASTTSHADIRSEIETLSTGVAYIDVTDNENVEIISHIDSELSETSENPVQNKVITNAISSLSAEIENQNTQINSDAYKQSIADLVTAHILGQPIVGIVDENNHIILNGTLPVGDYTLRYEGADGEYSEIVELTITEEDKIAYTNVLPLAQEYASTAPYVGSDGSVGYGNNMRISTSSPETTYMKALTGVDTAALIPVKRGDVLRFKNCNLKVTPSNTSYGTYIIGCDSSKALISGFHAKYDTISLRLPIVTDGDEIVQITLEPLAAWTTSNIDQLAYIQISTDGLDETSIITINEEIV